MSAETEFEKAELVLGDLEQLVVSQNVPYLLHMERLTGLKYLHDRLLELKRLESMPEDIAEKQVSDDS